MTYQNANGSGIDALQAANVNSLRVVAEPIAKVGALDEHRRPFLPVEECESLEDILDICKICERDAPQRRFPSSATNLHVANCDLQPAHHLGLTMQRHNLVKMNEPEQSRECFRLQMLQPCLVGAPDTRRKAAAMSPAAIEMTAWRSPIDGGVRREELEKRGKVQRANLGR